MNKSILLSFLSLVLSSPLLLAASIKAPLQPQSQQPLNHIIHDDARKRDIPISVYFPAQSQCSAQSPCKVAMFGAGYGMPNTDYTFLANTLNQQDVLMVSIAHELPNDPPLSTAQPFIKTRNENWQRGAQTVLLVREQLKSVYPEYNFDTVTLMGHSNGGDIAALLANQGYSFINAVITFDHRRVPLPRTSSIKVLSVRASDYPADDNVLPTQAEQRQFNSCVVTIKNARHNDMTDHGPLWLTQKMSTITAGFLQNKPCHALTLPMDSTHNEGSHRS